MNTLQGHTDAVKAVQFDENQIVAGYDDSVKIYDLLEGRFFIIAKNVVLTRIFRRRKSNTCAS